MTTDREMIQKLLKIAKNQQTIIKKLAQAVATQELDKSPEGLKIEAIKIANKLGARIDDRVNLRFYPSDNSIRGSIGFPNGTQDAKRHTDAISVALSQLYKLDISKVIITANIG